VPKDKRDKLEATRKKCFFVGYCENSREFKIYIPSHKKIEFSRDVTFDEILPLGNLETFLHLL